jgi:thiamine biosynthesis lipoprotein
MPNYKSIKPTSFLVLVLFLLGACTEEKTTQSYEAFSIQGETQGTTYTIIADNESLLELKPRVDAILLNFDRCLSSYRDSSIVSLFSNADAGVHNFRDIDGYFERCFKLSQEVYLLSEGAFDPSVFPLVEAWGFMKNPALEMTQNQVDSVKSLIGFESGIDYEFLLPDADDIHQLKKFTLNKIRPTLKLDFNAIAQGLSVDVLCEFLDEQGFTNYYVEIGGELRVNGTNKEGEFWRIGIDVADENNSVESSNRKLTSVISVNNRAVATSGSYRKFYEKDGVKRSHTIDPKTGFPVQHSLLSATVVANNAAFADAMATVFMVWGKDKTIDFVSKNRNLNLDILLQFSDDDGKIAVYYSQGMRELILE